MARSRPRKAAREKAAQARRDLQETTQARNLQLLKRASAFSLACWWVRICAPSASARSSACPIFSWGEASIPLALNLAKKLPAPPARGLR